MLRWYGRHPVTWWITCTRTCEEAVLIAGFVTIEDRDATRLLTMSNTDRMNAVPSDGWNDLADAFEAFEASEQRVLVVTGDGENFCSGADMNKHPAAVPSAADNAVRMRRTNRAALALHRLTKPTVAAVDGVAVGAGMNLAIGCDIVIATDRARFAEIFVKRGLTVDFGGTWLLPRLVGLAKARELALTGRVIAASEALAIGLVSEVVAPPSLLSTAMRVATELADGAPLAQSIIKRALDRSSSLSFEQALSFEEQAQAILLASEDLAEGSSAFIEKRKPEFKGR
jgi:2-(1,2-epoxy-1,2-dihydrophenyl)acetyl-CoA isomerase